MILRSLASSGQKFLSLDKLKLTSLNSWKLPERLLPSCRRSAMVHGSICLNPHFPAGTRSRYIVTTLSLHCHYIIAAIAAIATSRPSCRARTKQNRLRAKRHAQPMAPTSKAAPGYGFSGFSGISSSQLVGKRWVSTRVKSCFNGASTEVYNVLSSA